MANQLEKVWVVSYLNQTYFHSPREIYGVYASEELANKAADKFEESMNEDGINTEELEIEIEECIVEYNL